MYSDKLDANKDCTYAHWLYLITDNIYEDCLLSHLIKLQGKNENCYASLKTLGEYLHTSHKNTTENAIKSLKSKGYITYKRGNSKKQLANEYTVNLHKVVKDIRKNLPDKEKEQLAAKEYKYSQIRAMAAKTVGADKELLVRINTAQDLQVTDKKTGDILN